METLNRYGDEPVAVSIKQQKNKLKLGDYYRCYVSIFRLMEVSYERSKI